VAELDGGILLRRFDDERLVVAERGRQHEVGAVEIDHRFHRLGDGVGLRHVLFLDDGDARHLLQHVHGHRMRLVPAEIVARADIDGAEHDRRLRASQAERQCRGGETGGAGLEE